ncbi:MAG: hypothetical protein ACKO3N_17015, partial [Verrucomicrobiota bacterium]
TLAWHLIPPQTTTFRSPPGGGTNIFQPKPPPPQDPAARRAWENSIHSLSNLVANLQALDDLLQAAPLSESDRAAVVSVAGRRLLQDDWMLLCHHDRRLDPEALPYAWAEIDRARKAGEPVIPERVLFRSLRPSAPPRRPTNLSGKNPLQLFYEGFLKPKEAAGYRQVAEIVRRHYPGLDLSRSGTLQEAWSLTGLLEEIRDDREQERRRFALATLKAGPAASPPGESAPTPGAHQQDDPRLAALDQVYRQLFHRRFSRVPGLKDAETLVDELSRVSLGVAQHGFRSIPTP